MFGVLQLSDGLCFVADGRFAARRRASRLPAELDAARVLYPENVRVMRRAVAAIDPGAVALDDDRGVSRRFARLVEDGRLALCKQPPRRSATHRAAVESAGEPEAVPLVDLCQAHFVEFHFVDTRGVDVTGVEYVLEGPDRSQEEGTLRRTSQIRRSDVEPGTYRVTVKRVERVGWESNAMAWGDSVRILGRVSGYPDGTPARLKVYPEFSEMEGDEVWTAEVEVVDSAVEAVWTPDAQALDRDHLRVPLRCIAELSVDDGAHWAKTRSTLTVETPAIANARWAAQRVQVGKNLDIRVETRGIADGTPVALSVSRVGASGQLHEVETVDGIVVRGGRVDARWSPSDPDEYLFEASVDADGTQLSAMSEQVWASIT